MGALDAFEDVPEFYPGSKRPIIRHPNRTEPHMPDPTRWDANPKTLKVKGEDVEFFTVGQLALALGGRKPVTIRKWERLGIIPKPTFRKPSDDPRGQRRLYSRAQVEGMVRIAEEEGVSVPVRKGEKKSGKDVTKTNFTPRVIALFRELSQQ